MRYLTSMITATLISSGPLAAQASIQVCGDALLAATGHALYNALEVSPLQASHLQAIRKETSSYRQWLLRELDHVTRVLHGKQSASLRPQDRRRLQQHEASLIRQLEQQPARAAARAAAVLTTWQRDRCSRSAQVRASRPGNARPRPTVGRQPQKSILRAPRPVVERQPPKRIVREAPPRAKAKAKVKSPAPVKVSVSVKRPARAAPPATVRVSARPAKVQVNVRRAPPSSGPQTSAKRRPVR